MFVYNAKLLADIDDASDYEPVVSFCFLKSYLLFFYMQEDTEKKEDNKEIRDFERDLLERREHQNRLWAEANVRYVEMNHV